MSRAETIEFRGKRKLNGDWVYGSYFYQGGDFCRISPAGTEYEDFEDFEDFDFSAVRVITKTVGQYIGIEDEQGDKMFEGDVYEEDGVLYLIVYDSKTCFFRAQQIGPKRKLTRVVFAFELYGFNKVGNIHDSPQLDSNWPHK